ncbi:MAG: hypothetical protein ABEI52_08100, partial [Halobacteriaceae archaeon]
ISRRGANSSGNATVFEPGELDDLCDELPSKFDVEDIATAGITGSRRHMVIWHLVEHPERPFELVSRNPLVARKT